MSQESLKDEDDTKRDSGIFADLAVRPATEPPRVKGISIPPPPPRTRSSIHPIPAARKVPRDEPLTEPDSVATLGEGEALEPLEVSDTSPLVERSEVRPTPRSTVPPPPPRSGSSTLPGLPGVIPPAPGPRVSSIVPGTQPVSPAVQALASVRPAEPVAATGREARALEPTGVPMRELGHYGSREALARSQAADVLAKGAVGGAIGAFEPSALDTQRDPPRERMLDAHGTGTPGQAATGQRMLAVLLGCAVLAACVAWYAFAGRSVPGVVQLTTEPADAEVWFDGSRANSVSPFIKTGVLPNVKHQVEVRRVGFRSWSQEVEVQPGQSLAFTVALPREVTALPAEPSPAPRATAPGTAAAPVEPPTAAEPPQAPTAAAPIGNPSMEPEAEAPAPKDPPSPVATIASPAARKAAAPRERRAAAAARPVAEANQAAAAEAPAGTPAPARANGMGALHVTSRPWSTVTIDGNVVGNTPQRGVALAEGKHVVQLRNPEFDVEKTLTVTIQAGQTETLIVTLP